MEGCPTTLFLLERDMLDALLAAIAAKAFEAARTKGGQVTSRWRAGSQLFRKL